MSTGAQSHTALQSKDKRIGKLRINVRDVVRNLRLRDTFALQESQQGEIALTLEWLPIAVAG